MTYLVTLALSTAPCRSRAFDADSKGGGAVAQRSELRYEAGRRNRQRRTMQMACVMAVYKTPRDPAAFDKYYFEKHVPIAKRIPGLRKYEVSKGPVATPAGPSGLHLIGVLHFDDMAAVQKAFATAEGQAAAADVQNFATGGADLYMFDTRQV
jgi:uncharacterized protein (TIGR02118 family)